MEMSRVPISGFIFWRKSSVFLQISRSAADENAGYDASSHLIFASSAQIRATPGNPAQSAQLRPTPRNRRNSAQPRQKGPARVLFGKRGKQSGRLLAGAEGADGAGEHCCRLRPGNAGLRIKEPVGFACDQSCRGQGVNRLCGPGADAAAVREGRCC